MSPNRPRAAAPWWTGVLLGLIPALPWGIALASAQDSPRPPDDPEARSLLERAAAAQGDPAFELPVRDYRLEGEMTTYDPRGRIIFDFQLLYATPSRLWSRLEEVAFSRWTISGFDGTTGWLQDAKGVVPLVGREFRRDREELRSRLVLARTLLDAFVVRRALRRGSGWTLESEDTVSAEIHLDPEEREALEKALGPPAAGESSTGGSATDTPAASIATEDPLPAKEGTSGAGNGTEDEVAPPSPVGDAGEPEAVPAPVTLRLRFQGDPLRIVEARLRIPPLAGSGEPIDQTTVFGERQIDAGGGFLLPADLTVKNAAGERLFRVRLRTVAFNRGVSEGFFRMPR